jgi:hypothetical protein
VRLGRLTDGPRQGVVDGEPDAPASGAETAGLAPGATLDPDPSPGCADAAGPPAPGDA